MIKEESKKNLKFYNFQDNFYYELIQKMLELNPTKRPIIFEIL